MHGATLKFLNILADIFSIVFLGIMVVCGIQMVIRTSYQTSPAMMIPMSWVYVVIPFGCAVMLIYVAANLVDVLKRPLAKSGRLPLTLCVILISFIVILSTGASIGVGLGLSSAIVLYCVLDMPLVVVVQRMFTSVILLSWPCAFFMLAGAFMSEGGVTKRIVDFSMAMVGALLRAVSR